MEWTTASELSTAGFNLYRSGSADGSFSQINNELIPASTDPLTGGSYEYIDSHVEPGITYYYELEDVEFDGNSSRYGPIEVQASRGGSLELWFSLFLIGAGIVGLLLQNRKRAEKHERHQPR